MNSETFWLSFWSIFFIAVLVMVAGFLVSDYKSEQIRIVNFENTIQDLTEEQKCLHICGFQWYGSYYFDNYKFCVEKCDRISERGSLG